MEVWIVFEHTEYGNKIVGIYNEEENKKHKESPTWRYVETYKVD